jgi:hypothetical protein
MKKLRKITDTQRICWRHLSIYTLGLPQFKSYHVARDQWLTPVILATQEAGFKASPGKYFFKTLSRKKKKNHKKKWWWSGSRGML